MFFSNLIKLAFPNNCISCFNSLVKNEKFICSTCHFYIPKGEKKMSQNTETGILFPKEDFFIGACHLLDFDKDGRTHKILHELKYNSNLKLGVYLGKLIGIEFSSQLEQFDYLIPVPLHPKKMYLRGYNQSDLICKGINEIIKKKVLTKNLIRIKHTETQTKKNKLERLENMKNAFNVCSPASLENKTVLLVDDVITTGATLIECMKVLQPINGIKIGITALAKTTYA